MLDLSLPHSETTKCQFHSARPLQTSRQTDCVLTGYDELHKITYLRLLDAEAEHADWREVARLVLKSTPTRNLNGHIARGRPTSRAHWMTEQGYNHFCGAALRTDTSVACRYCKCLCMNPTTHPLRFDHLREGGGAFWRTRYAATRLAIAVAYEDKRKLDAPGFAFEFLSRNPEFLKDHNGSGGFPANA